MRNIATACDTNGRRPISDAESFRANSAFRPIVGLLILSLSTVALASSSDVPFHNAMGDVMERMHRGMSIAPSGDVDRDFAAMMIPHHQGAIDMAILELRHGSDERLRRVAQGIIVEQGQEIRVMQGALVDLGSRSTPGAGAITTHSGDHR